MTSGSYRLESSDTVSDVSDLGRVLPASPILVAPTGADYPANATLDAVSSERS